MGKKKCKYCKSSIPASAYVCGKCGREQYESDFERSLHKYNWIDLGPPRSSLGHKIKHIFSRILSFILFFLIIIFFLWFFG